MAEPSLAQRLSTMVFGGDEGAGTGGNDSGSVVVAQGGAMAGALLLAPGLLKVTVHSAEGVHNVQHDDFFTVTEQEPYVFVRLKGVDGGTVGGTARTGCSSETGTQGREPKWDLAELEVQVTPTVQTVSVELWNHNMVKDDHIGTFEAPIIEQLLYLNQRAWYHLDTGGMIELTFSHVPAKPAAPVVVPSTATTKSGGGGAAAADFASASGCAVVESASAAAAAAVDEVAAEMEDDDEEHIVSKTIRNSLANLSLLITTTKPPPGSEKEEGEFTPPGSPQPRSRMKDKQRRAFEASPEFKQRSRSGSVEGSATGSPKRRASGGAAETEGVLASVQSILAGVTSQATAAVTDFSTGTLVIEAHAASDLKVAQLFGTMDPYAVVKLEGTGAGEADAEPPPVLQEARTMYAFRGGIEPEWDRRLDSRMELPLSEDATALLVDVFNHNLVQDDLLGQLRLPLMGAGKIGLALGKRATYDLLPQGKIELTISHGVPAADA